MIPSFLLFWGRFWNASFVHIEGLEFKFGHSIMVLKDEFIIWCVDLYEKILKEAESYFTSINELFVPQYLLDKIDKKPNKHYIYDEIKFP